MHKNFIFTIPQCKLNNSNPQIKLYKAHVRFSHPFLFTVIYSGYSSITTNKNSTNVSEATGFSTSVALLLVDMILQPEQNKIKN
jgi:hypothetical protein